LALPPADGHGGASAEATQTDDRVEIELGNGRLVRVGSGVDMDSLRRILDAADGR
jgi:transposase